MSRALRILILCLALLFIFGASVAVLMRVLPGPHTEMDYLVIGAVATFATLLALFLALITTWVKSPDIFFKRRKE